MRHALEVEDAIRFGVISAILLNDFRYRVGLNRRTREHQLHGRTWMKTTWRALLDKYPYLNHEEMTLACNDLVKHGYLLISPWSGKLSFDEHKPLWVAFFDQTEFAPEAVRREELHHGRN